MSAPTLSPYRSRPSATRTRPAARPRERAIVVPARLEVGDNPASAVFRVARSRGPIGRDVAAEATGLSVATVGRQVSALLDLGLLRERADLTPSGTVGRPRIPFDVDHETFLTVGIHIGAVATSVVASDLRGRILGAIEIVTPESGPDGADALRSIASSAKAFVARWHRRRPLWVGVAIGGRVDQAHGVVDHARLGWTGAQVGPIIGAGLGLPVSVAAHVEAMAAAELLLAPDRAEHDATGETEMYFYARETAGVSLAIDGRVHTPAGGPGSIAHFPTGSSVQCACGATGCLEATVSDRAIVAAAVSRGVVDGSGRVTVADVVAAASNGSEAAQEVLTARARALGRTVATLRELLNPDRVILGGQAFTEYQPGLAHVAAAIGERSRFGSKDIRVSGFGNRVQQHASAVTSLGVLFADPVKAFAQIP